MTVTFALAIDEVGLVAADTRLNFSFRDGRSGVQDSGPIDVTFSDSTRIRVGENYRKIRAVGSDWACGAGSFGLVEAGLSALAAAQTTADAGRILSEVRAREVPRLAREFNAQQAVVERASILYTRTSGGRTTLGGYGFNGSNPVPPGSQFVFQAPPDLPPSENARIVADLQNELVVPSSTENLYTVIRAVARAFSRAVLHSRTVSDRMEVGVTVRRVGTGRYALLAGMSAIENASERKMERLLRRA